MSYNIQIFQGIKFNSDSSVRKVQVVGLRPLACWEWSFESRRGLRYPSLVFCHVEVSADHLSRGVRQSVIEEPHVGGLGPLGMSSHEKKKKIKILMLYEISSYVGGQSVYHLQGAGNSNI